MALELYNVSRSLNIYMCPIKLHHAPHELSQERKPRELPKIHLKCRLYIVDDEKKADDSQAQQRRRGYT